MCGEVCVTEDNWEQHNNDMAHWACTKCDETFSSLWYLENHENRYGHQPSDGESVEELEESYYSGSDYSNEYDSEDSGYECNYCDRVFGSERALQQRQNDTGHYY